MHEYHAWSRLVAAVLQCRQWGKFAPRRQTWQVAKAPYFKQLLTSKADIQTSEGHAMGPDGLPTCYACGIYQFVQHSVSLSENKQIRVVLAARKSVPLLILTGWQRPYTSAGHDQKLSCLASICGVHSTLCSLSCLGVQNDSTYCGSSPSNHHQCVQHDKRSIQHQPVSGGPWVSIEYIPADHGGFEQ